MKRALCLFLSLFLLMLVFVLFSVSAFAEELSLIDQMNAASVYYISDREFLYYEKEDVYVLRFSLKDKDKEYLASPANVQFSIQNNEGEVIYKEERKILKTIIMYGQAFCLAKKQWQQ